MKKIRFGVIGLGQRGYGVLQSVLVHFDEIEITAVCDLYQDRVDEARKFVKEKCGNEPFGTTDYKELLASGKVDAVYVASAWESHVAIAIDSLRAGVITGMEVGGAYDVNTCFELVRAYEETGTPFMMMENCCFDKWELLATSMARAGKFGEIVHAHGAYAHDLRWEISKGNIIRHYRLRNYTKRNCENYPTHELGPIAKVLNITRGNRFTSLISVASKARGLSQFTKDHPELIKEDPTLEDRVYHQGDIVNTIITCANGETITLRLDTTLPRSYDREFTLRGTKGFYTGTNNIVFLDGDKEYWDNIQYHKDLGNSGAKYEEEFLPPLWKNVTEEQLKSGHGGMDGLMWGVFVDCILNKKEMPVDVYDAACWMAVSALSEASIAQGGAPQAFPDFTDGKWLLREPKDVVPLH